mmetsp:Transcript_37932/g.90094  ORF Transcript_37932/g.90094 Transcript_37932/m.90094 type:complete len:240 (-) Transcript_37932:19-738(-)
MGGGLGRGPPPSPPPRLPVAVAAAPMASAASAASAAAPRSSSSLGDGVWGGAPPARLLGPRRLLLLLGERGRPRLGNCRCCRRGHGRRLPRGEGLPCGDLARLHTARDVVDLALGPLLLGPLLRHLHVLLLQRANKVLGGYLLWVPQLWVVIAAVLIYVVVFYHHAHHVWVAEVSPVLQRCGQHHPPLFEMLPFRDVCRNAWERLSSGRVPELRWKSLQRITNGGRPLNADLFFLFLLV